MFKLLAIAAASVAICGSANAGYAQLAPPGGWGPGTYAPSANDASYGRIIYSPNGPTANVGGQAVKMPAAYRLAANAPRVAAAAIFLNPYVRAGVAIASWLGLAKLVWDAANNRWVQQDTSGSIQSTGVRYSGPGQVYVDSPWDACRQYTGSGFSDWAVYQSGTQVICTFKKDGQSYFSSALKTYASGQTCPTGWWITPAGCVQTPQPKQVTQKEFEDALAPQPMPERVPQELPQPTPLPIETPSPWINPEPGPSPAHRPLFVPTGDPVPNPNYDPNAPASPENQPWYQPGTRIVPSPTADQPWRVDYRPVDRPQPTPQPNPNPQPGTDPTDKPKPEDQQDLCQKNPNIVACENGDVNDSPLPEVPKLYERKYPDGLIGIWNQKSQLIKQASMFTLASQLMPTSLNAGVCPAWQIELNFARWASYGAHNVAPPCWIWDVAKTIILISALLLARALVFGG